MRKNRQGVVGTVLFFTRRCFDLQFGSIFICISYLPFSTLICIQKVYARVCIRRCAPVRVDVQRKWLAHSTCAVYVPQRGVHLSA